MAAERNFEGLWAAAEAAGLAAGAAVKPRPMIVRQDSILVNGEPALDRDYFVPEGACGFAWVVVRPGNAPFAKWCRKNKASSKHYYGGEQVKWVGEFEQSVERKCAYAYAFADVLQAAGIQAVADSRLD